MLRGVLIFFATLSAACEQGILVDFDIKTVEAIVRDEAPKSVEEFLASTLIPDSMRKRFLLLKQSFSIQEASADCPRVLMYNSDATLSLSFNCGDLASNSLTAHGAASIEIARLNKQTGDYENYDISFASKSGATLSNVNPQFCISCHHAQDTIYMGKNWKWMSKAELSELKASQFSSSKSGKLRYSQLDWSENVSIKSMQALVTQGWKAYRNKGRWKKRVVIP